MFNVQEEFQDYIQAGFNPVLTADQTLSLQPAEAFGVEQEQMHSRGGALSESLFVYFDALNLFFDQPDLAAGAIVESVGLGLGYNEVLTAVAALNKKKHNIELWSYESEKILEPLFFKRLEKPDSYPFYWSQFKQKIEFDLLEVCSFLKRKIDLKGALNRAAVEKNEKKQRLILFDAYSNKTSESLWTPEFLKAYLATCSSGSVLSTYAATGVLKRCLEDEGFENLNKTGFLKKRQSTLARKI